MSRWKCVCAYDGTGFSGWQSQQTKDSVQDTLEARLEDVLKMHTRIHGSGRTDSGVHAAGQVVLHARNEDPLGTPPEVISVGRGRFQIYTWGPFETVELTVAEFGACPTDGPCAAPAGEAPTLEAVP